MVIIPSIFFLGDSMSESTRTIFPLPSSHQCNGSFHRVYWNRSPYHVPHCCYGLNMWVMPLTRNIHCRSLKWVLPEVVQRNVCPFPCPLITHRSWSYFTGHFSLSFTASLTFSLSRRVSFYNKKYSIPENWIAKAVYLMICRTLMIYLTHRQGYSWLE